MKARALVTSGALLAACTTGPPDRDVFVPPYAEKGCWARVYGQNGFSGPMRELEGPVFVEALGATPVIVPNLDAIPPQPRFSEVKSMTVGPHARIVGYGGKLFREPVIELPPGTRVPDARELAFLERVRSFRMECVA